MRQISSTHESPESIAATLVAAGKVVEPEPAKVEEAKPDAEGDKDEPETKEPEVKATEGDEDPDQDTTQDKKGEQPPKKKGGFQAKIEKLEQRNQKKDQQLAQANREIEELRAKVTKEETPAVTEEKLEAPTLPTLADHDYEQDKYDAAMKQYAADLSTYYQKLSEKTVNDTLAKKEQERVQKEAGERADKEFNEFTERLNAGAANIPDFDDATDAIRDDKGGLKLPEVFQVAIFKSKDPAGLMHHLATHPDDVKRIGGLEAFDQFDALKELEFEIRTAKKGTKEPTPKGKEPEPVAAPPKPAQPKPSVQPTKPVTPVGHGSAATNASLAGLTGKAYREARAAGVNR